ncbi:MAG: MarR family transcriptional regulator [Bacteroidales bacterium]|nr:MarR family transcriptional regulator [Bacteroidales bacterium]
MNCPQLLLDNQLCFRLYTASRLITQAYTPFLEGLGLTYPQYLVMMVLWENDGQPVNDIAKRLVLETNTVTPLLKRMESAGLVERLRDAADGRKVMVRLTAAGKALKARAASVPEGLAAELAPCRSLSPESAPQVFRMLDEIIATLK